MRAKRALAGFALAAGLVACSSTPVAPRVQMVDGFPGQKPLTIYVLPEQDGPAIQESLEKVGFTVAPDAGSASYLLRVAVGGKRATKPCGTVHNVRYQLGSDATTVLEIKARGLTGSCRPNVYDEMSGALRSAFPPAP